MNRVPIADLYPELVEGIPAERRQSARDQLGAPVESVAMWHMADRWGKVGTEGVHVPLKMSHRALGQLVGAQRPSVTTALRQLASEGRLSRSADGTWMLHGDPPETFEHVHEAAAGG
jgi:Crp-like helix-turn-helix domain